MRIKIFFTSILLVPFCAVLAQSNTIKIKSLDASRFPNVTMKLQSKEAIKKEVLVLQENAKKVNEFTFTENGSSTESTVTGKSPSFFLIEASSFLNAQQLVTTKQAVKRHLSQMQSPAMANVAYYVRSNSVEMLKRVSTEFTTDYATLASDEMVKIQPANDKNPVVDLYKVVAEAIDFMGSRTNLSGNKNLYVISTGNNNGNSAFSLNDCIKKAKENKITVNAVGIYSSTSNAIDNLKLLASNTGGKFSYAKSEEDIFNSLGSQTNNTSTNDADANSYIYNLTWTSAESSKVDSIALEVAADSVTTVMSYTPAIDGEDASRSNFLNVNKWYLLGGILAASLLGFLLYRSASKKNKLQKEQHEATLRQQSEERQIQEAKIAKEKVEREKKVNLNPLTAAPTVVVKNDPQRTTISSGYNPSLSLKIQGAYTHYPISKSSTTIGRTNSNDIVIADGTVSGSHAILTIEGSEMFITDQQSTNGTMVNGNRISKIKLSKGDTIQLGQVAATYTV